MTEYEYSVRDDKTGYLHIISFKESVVDNWLRAYAEEEGSTDGLTKLYRPVNGWRIWEPPKDYSIDREDIGDFMTGMLANGYVKHAFLMDGTWAEMIAREGLNRYYGNLQDGRSRYVKPYCASSSSWMTRVMFYREDILDLVDETKPMDTNPGAVYHSVCLKCQAGVRAYRARQEKNNGSE